MKMIRSSNRCAWRPRLALLLLGLTPLAAAAELPLRAFSADYDLFLNGMHVATSKLELKRAQDSWRWTMQTNSRGIYAWFIDKSPYSETTFNQQADGPQLQQIVISDTGDRKKYESARFDWRQKQIKVLRRGKRKSLPLSERVYDYQSIHLLAAAMRQRQEAAITVDFYRKGKLVKSSLSYRGEGKVRVRGKSVAAHVFLQTIVRSSSKLRYYYAADNPFLPLRIEKSDTGDGPTVMTLKQVDWTL